MNTARAAGIRRLVATIALASALLRGDAALAARGGPDTFGYDWRDSALRGGGQSWCRDFGDPAVVAWIGAPSYTDNTVKPTLEVLLCGDGRIVAQYKDILGPSDSARVGIESAADTDGLTAYFNTP